MKKINYIIISILFLTSYISSAQQDAEAKKILDSFSKKTKSYQSFKLDFTLTFDNLQTKEKTDTKGYIIMKGNKYKMDLNGNEIYFDGKDIYNYSSDANEVSISKPDEKSDESLLTDPSKLFNLYSKGYKYRYIGELNVEGIDCHEIDLFPEDLKKKYSIVKLLINKEKLELKMVKLVMKSGVNYILNINKFNNKAEAKDPDFIFNIKAHQGVEVVDLR